MSAGGREADGGAARMCVHYRRGARGGTAARKQQGGDGHDLVRGFHQANIGWAIFRGRRAEGLCCHVEFRLGAGLREDRHRQHVAIDGVLCS